jgi:hypothetical protein
MKVASSNFPVVLGIQVFAAAEDEELPEQLSLELVMVVDATDFEEDLETKDAAKH